MAPEQILGKPHLASDQYALGIVVYEWLTGSVPFRGSFTEICAQHIHASLPPLHTQRPDLHSDVAQVLAKALAKTPEARFITVRAFVSALEEVGKQTVRRGPPPSIASTIAARPLPATVVAPSPVVRTAPAASTGQTMVVHTTSSTEQAYETLRKQVEVSNATSQFEGALVERNRSKAIAKTWAVLLFIAGAWAFCGAMIGFSIHHGAHDTLTGAIVGAVSLFLLMTVILILRKVRGRKRSNI
jgi:serine/threonine protein kinase